jgi:hypothetical protein
LYEGLKCHGSDPFLCSARRLLEQLSEKSRIKHDIMDDGSYVPRANGANILDFQNSVVNIIFNSAPNAVAGTLRVFGYCIITTLDVIFLSIYIPLLLLIVYLLRRFQAADYFSALWNLYSGWLFEVQAILPTVPSHLASAWTTTVTLPNIKALARKLSWHVKLPTSWPFKYQKPPVTPAAARKRPGRQPTFKTPPQSPHATPEFVAAESSPRTLISEKQSLAVTQKTPVGKSPRTAAAAKRTPPVTPLETRASKATAAKAIEIESPTWRAPTSTSPAKKSSKSTGQPSSWTAFLTGSSRETAPAKQPSKTFQVNTASFGLPASTNQFHPLNNTHEIDKEPISSAGTPTTFANNGFVKKSEKWVPKFGKFLLSMIWDHKGKAFLGGLGLVAVYSYIDSIPSDSNSRSVASFFDGLRPAYVLEPIQDIAIGLLDTLWALPFVILNSCGLFLDLLAKRIVSLISMNFSPATSRPPRIAGFPASTRPSKVDSFYQALWKVYSSVVGGASVAAFGNAKTRLLGGFLLLTSTILSSLGSSISLTSVALSAFSLLAIALAAWATQSFADFTKKICPHIAGFPFSILTWQPVFWSTIFWVLHHLNYFSLSHLTHFRTRDPNFWYSVFAFLAIWKGFKIFIHTCSYYLWTNPAQAPQNPTITPADVTVVVPTVCNWDKENIDCIYSILANKPARIIVSVVGHDKRLQTIRACEEIDPRIEVVSVDEANKRTQLLKAVEDVRTDITVYADDHVFWPGTFLRSALAPFEDPIVGLVGTSKRVIRNHDLPLLDNFFNYIACIYLERHNFECTATYNIDGGVFVISGRTGLVRTSVIHSLAYRTEFQSEYFRSIASSVGPIKVDDDNFNTRFMVRHGFKTVFHNDEKALIRTTLVSGEGQLEKFNGQLMRWARTTWRSNLKSLITDRACYRHTPWTTYAMFLSPFVNIAIIYDSILFATLYLGGGGKHVGTLALVLVLTKLIKPLPHLMREKSDWKFVPGGILFGYAHGIIRIIAFLTMNNVEWSGRSGIKATA